MANPKNSESLQIVVPRDSDDVGAPGTDAAGAKETSSADLPVVPRPGEQADDGKNKKGQTGNGTHL